MEETVRLRSIINKYFSKELLTELYFITLYNCDNNTKGVELKNVLEKFGFERYDPTDNDDNEELNEEQETLHPKYALLGSGTNRYGILIDGYVIKIALDKDGMIDNRREFLYGRECYPDVVKVYECIPNGLVAVFEYVTIFTIDDLRMNRERMKTILKRLSDDFLIGDVGIDSRNYVNWGTRPDGSICILDFAYIYSTSYKLFRCKCDNATLLTYDDDFIGIRCPKCGKIYQFKDIRKRITKKDQENEIGDIRRLGYCLTKPVEVVKKVQAFIPPALLPKKKKVNEKDRIRKEYAMMKKRHGRVLTEWEIPVKTEEPEETINQ